MRQFLLSSVFVAASAAFAMAQGTGSEGYFDVHNDTGSNVLIGFYTNDGGGWSANWLEGELVPATVVTVEFLAETGSCEQVFRAGWLGEDGASEVLDEPFTIDICEASNVYLGDNEIVFD